MPTKKRKKALNMDAIIRRYMKGSESLLVLSKRHGISEAWLRALILKRLAEVSERKSKSAKLNDARKVWAGMVKEVGAVRMARKKKRGRRKR